MLATKLAIHTRNGGHIVRLIGRPLEPERVIEAGRLIGHLNGALNDDGYPWSPVRQLIVFNPEHK